MSDNSALLEEIYERAIGERAVVCKNWIWAAGMLVSVPPEKGSEKRTTKRLDEGQVVLKNSGYIPIFKDATTRSRLHTLVRKAYGPEAIILLTSSKPTADSGAIWRISVKGRFTPGANYQSEAEALVTALEAANVQP